MTTTSTAPLDIAIISYHLYNVTAEGLQAAKIACLLRDRGHHVEIFTSDHNWLDGTRVMPTTGPLADLTIHRIASPRPEQATPWRRRLLAWQPRGGLRGKVAAIPNLIQGADYVASTWARHAAKALLARDRHRPFDLIHTRLNPPQSHLAALHVRRRKPALPWCAYFSDPWPFHRFPPPYQSDTGPALKWRLERRLAAMHRQADMLVYPSRWLRDAQLANATPTPEHVVIPHVTNIWSPPEPSQRGDTLRILHAGFLMAERKIDALLMALRRLLARRPETRDILRLEFIGRYTGRDVPTPPDDLDDVVIYHRFERPSAIWSWLLEADVLMLVEADLETGIFFPSKLADYLGAGRPILALSPPRGVAADLLGNADSASLLAPPEDDAAIERALETLVDAWRDRSLDRLLPPEAARRSVSGENVGRRYEAACRAAIHHHAAHTPQR